MSRSDQSIAINSPTELDVVWAGSQPERAASWLGRQLDGVVVRLLRRLFHGRPVPYTSPEELERSLGMLHCYSDLADPERFFAPPAKLPAVVRRWSRVVRGGRHSHLTFATPYRPLHYLYNAEFQNYDRLDTVHLFAWEHARPAPVSILLTHGWGLGHKAVHEREFGLDFLFRRLGLDVYYYVAPFHGLRRPSAVRFSGELHPSPNLMRTNEAFIQTAKEVRTAIGLIKANNRAPLGMMGSSLGGYTTALIASIDDRLDFAVPVMPPGSLADLFWQYGHSDPIRTAVEKAGMNLSRLRKAWALHSPLSYRPKVSWEARLMVSARGDGFIRHEHIQPLWDHWDRPRHVQFAGGHILQLYRHHYHHEVGRLLARLGLLSHAKVREARL